MPKGIAERWEGHIPGLRLPLNTWDALQREGITTIEQLRAMAARIHWLPGIGRKSAQIIREELARLAPPDQDQ
jgi:DNA-directed RNA polymerase alpha subunit